MSLPFYLLRRYLYYYLLYGIHLTCLDAIQIFQLQNKFENDNFCGYELQEEIIDILAIHIHKNYLVATMKQVSYNSFAYSMIITLFISDFLLARIVLSIVII